MPLLCDTGAEVFTQVREKVSKQVSVQLKIRSFIVHTSGPCAYQRRSRPTIGLCGLLAELIFSSRTIMPFANVPGPGLQVVGGQLEMIPTFSCMPTDCM